MILMSVSKAVTVLSIIMALLTLPVAAAVLIERGVIHKLGPDQVRARK